MKKTIALILSIFMILAVLASCGGNAGTESTTIANTSQSVEGTKAPAVTTKATVTTTAVTTAAVTTEKIEAAKEGVMVFYETFDGQTDTSDNNSTMTALGWTLRSKADGALTDNTATWTIENGMLKVHNKIDGCSDSYVQLASSDYMKNAMAGSYTLQYDLKYTDASDYKRYIVMLTDYDGYDTYNSAHLRICGYGNNQCRFAGTFYTYDASGELYFADKKDGDGTTTAINKLLGVNYQENVYGLQDISLTLKYVADKEKGPKIYLRDNSKPDAEFVQVSEPSTSAGGFMYWDLFESYALAIKAGGGIDGYVDNIALWTGTGDMPSDTTTAEYEAEVAKLNK